MLVDSKEEKNFKCNKALIEFLDKLGMKHLDKARLENNRRYTWIQITHMMGYLNMEMFSTYPFITDEYFFHDRADDQTVQNDQDGLDYLKWLHKK